MYETLWWAAIYCGAFAATYVLGTVVLRQLWKRQNS